MTVSPWWVGIPTPGGMVDQSLVPGGDFLIKGSGGADKFIDSNLDQGLQDRGIESMVNYATLTRSDLIKFGGGRPGPIPYIFWQQYWSIFRFRCRSLPVPSGRLRSCAARHDAIAEGRDFSASFLRTGLAGAIPRAFGHGSERERPCVPS